MKEREKIMYDQNDDYGMTKTTQSVSSKPIVGRIIGGVGGLIAGVPLSYFFLDSMIRSKISLETYIKEVAPVYLNPANLPKVPDMGDIDTSIALTLWITMIICGVVGTFIGYLIDKLNEK